MTENPPPLVVPDLLRLRTEHHSDQVAMRVDGRVPLTYGEWDARSNGVARGLLERGVSRGDRIGLVFGGMDWIDYVVSYLGVLKAGATALHLSERVDDGEVRRRIEECGVVGVIKGDDQETPPFRGWVSGRTDLESTKTDPVEVDIAPTDLSDILYTSGTTGPAKALGVPHHNLTHGRAPGNFRQLGDPLPLLVPVPVCTTPSVTTTSVTLSSPATLIICPPGDTERMAELITEFRIGSVMINPAVAIALVNSGVEERFDLSCVDTLGTASAPCPPALSRKLLRMFPNAKLNMAYTAAEAYTGLIINTFDPARPMSLGRPAEGSDVKITNAVGEPLPDGRVGTIWVGSDAPKRRYLFDDELTAHVQVGRWTRTGDLGHIGEDGELYLFDREKDVIETGDRRVSTIAVEAVLYDHPSVQEAAVLGLSDAEHGQVVAAVVVLDDADRLDEVRDFAAARLAPHELPTRMLAADALPRSVNAKVLKRYLLPRFEAAPDAPPPVGISGSTPPGSARPTHR